MQQIINSLPGAQDQFRKILIQCATENPNSLRTIVTLMAFYLHLGPFSRHVIEQIEHRIAELETASPGQPVSAIPADVMDAGTGIPPAERERVFVPFFRLGEAKGSGLGLSIARQIARLHGGEVAAIARPDSASCIRVTIPVS